MELYIDDDDDDYDYDEVLQITNQHTIYFTEMVHDTCCLTAALI